MSLTPESTIRYRAANMGHYVVVSTSPSLLGSTWHISDSCVLVVLEVILVIGGCGLERLCRRRMVRSSDRTELRRNRGLTQLEGCSCLLWVLEGSMQ